MAALEWLDWFGNRRLLGSIGNSYPVGAVLCFLSKPLGGALKQDGK
ncbi:MAG: hypothetical protein LBE32_06520 [Burkholderiales bacterium]|jgi:hypothetical protein|nr:hypothetical protein [Burkholderiales bacterium]